MPWISTASVSPQQFQGFVKSVDGRFSVLDKTLELMQKHMDERFDKIEETLEQIALHMRLPR